MVTLSTPLRLASASPRRRELLAWAGWGFAVEAADIDERAALGESPAETATRLARQKARQVRSTAEGWTLAADTVVVHRGQVLGKPRDRCQAVEMLSALQGEAHRVVTAIAVRNARTGEELIDVCETEVPMRDLYPEEIEAYVASGSPLDKAGAYGIQDGGVDPVDVKRMNGCFANVMGMPMCHVVRTFRRIGLEPAADVPAACRAQTGYECRVHSSILKGEL